MNTTFICFAVIVAAILAWAAAISKIHTGAYADFWYATRWLAIPFVVALVMAYMTGHSLTGGVA